MVSNLLQVDMPDNKKLKDYDDEPVQYCTRCYSLKIRHEEQTDTDFCMNCGCTETATATIDKWEKMFEERYGRKYVEKAYNPRGSVYFAMNIQELKKTAYKNKHLPYILRKLYPGFPKGYSKSDSILMLFDRLSKDNRIDDLRYVLYDVSRNIMDANIKDTII